MAKDDLDLTPEELEKESKKAKAELDKKSKAKKEEVEPEGRTFTEAQVKQMLSQLAKDIKNDNGNGDDQDIDEMNKQKICTIPRFSHTSEGKQVTKYVYSFKNMNTDEYYPDLVIQAQDIWNAEQKRMIPWITAIFEDGSELFVPLETIIRQSKKVPVDLVEIIKKDTTQSQGSVEVAEVGMNDWSPKRTGAYRKLKVTQFDYQVKIRFPDGKEAIVGKEVVNWETPQNK